MKAGMQVVEEEEESEEEEEVEEGGGSDSELWVDSGGEGDSGSAARSVTPPPVLEVDTVPKAEHDALADKYARVVEARERADTRVLAARGVLQQVVARLQEQHGVMVEMRCVCVCVLGGRA